MKINFKSRKGLIGITLALYYVASLITFILTLSSLVKIEITSAMYLSMNAKAYYAARAGLEHAISIIKATPDSETLPGDRISSLTPDIVYTKIAENYKLGTLLNSFDLYYDVNVWKSCDVEGGVLRNTENTVIGFFNTSDLRDPSMPAYLSDGTNVYMISATGWITVGGTERTRKSLQCVYQRLSAGSRIIAWRELYSTNNPSHSYLANHN
ncbi:MAG: hypothetical protein KA792_09685 [Bacteroidales bacterium]|nr:hypothetical protein [Bacteroidales bacterium]